jgi:hypothetical protein
MNVEERILQVPEHFRGDVLATLYGPRGRIAKSIKKVQNADILDRTAEARKQAWSLGHFSKGNREADTLILDALLAAFFKCECINETSKEFLEMLEESLTNGAAAELGDRR